ncbi:hypothetical protein RYH73_26420 [Olivibacter sp. CPCC 100613]|uniref:hypothetical protein n=1 Tax=Olivibacter sp. CPCC 100613 TaxID=3079931 RepID=UPI002FFCC02B
MKIKFAALILLMGFSLASYAQNTFPTTGNVGIGTTSPTDLLQLNHGTARKGISIVGDGDGSAYSDITFKINDVSAIPNGATWAWTMSHRRDGYFSSSAFPGSSIEFYGLRKGGGYYAPLSFKSNGDVILASPKNAPSGNVGIGTTNPTSKLTIDGNINGWLISSKATVTSAGEYNGIKLLTGYPNDTNKWAAVVATAEDLHSNSTGLALYSSASERVRIAGNGNVGIGTTSPQAKLAVNGNILAKEIKVKTDISVPDYVFEPDYKMYSLAEIENYVKEHKHLPEIPSAKKIGEDGLDLGEMNLLLLKKVEELTLHLIELEKRLADVEKE